jgi:hypothetical protein
MSYRAGTKFIIKKDPNHKPCSMCGKVAELRPYGKDCAEICYDCGMLDEAATTAEFKKLVEGTEIFLAIEP